MDVEIGDLPVWKGVQNRPGFDKLNFALYTDNGLIRLKLPKKEIFQISTSYSKEDYTFISSPSGSSSWGNRRGDLYFNILAAWVGTLSTKNVLEIGSGTLYIAQRVVNELKAQQFIACDPAIELCSPSKKIVVSKNYFSYELFYKKNHPIDLIISISNFEHIPDYRLYLEEVRKLLDPKTGLFFIVVPDCTRGLKTGDLGICVHEHMSYFTTESITQTLSESGFSIVNILSHEDTLFVLAKPKNKDTFSHISYPESDNLLQNYGGLVKSNLIYFENLLHELTIMGPVALHGCCVGLNNTLGLLGICDGPDIFLFDGDGQKQGKFMPAFNRPIYSSHDITYRKMKSVIIAASTFYEEIKQEIEISHSIPSGSIYPIISQYLVPDQ